jgi:ferredoxin-NADP reductase
LLGFAILQKTRRGPLSGTFLGLATILVIIVLMAEGETLGGSLVLWLSWPIMFFASFMLTEPLTLPGKKWQQILEAAVVAILFAIPINIGDFSTSPAFALIVGNLIAFGFARRQKVTLTFNEQKQLTPTTYEFIFTPHTSRQYVAGQYIEIRVPHKHDDFRGSRRSFSITSAPGDETLRLGVKFYDPSSSFKKALRELKKGSVIESTGISGDFTLPKDTLTPLLYVAGGIGITPFISHLQTLKRRKEARDIVLFYSISSIDELAYKDILEAAGIKVFIITKTAQGLTLPKNWVHINEPFITKDILATYVSDVAARSAYISGPPLMIDGVKKQLKRLHVAHIKTDYFIGY